MTNHNITILGFVDDLIITASSTSRTHQLLDITNEYLEALEIGVAAQKCEAFKINKINKMFTVTDIKMRCVGETIPYKCAAARLKCLRIEILPWDEIIT